MTKRIYQIVGQKFLGLDPYLAGIEVGVEATLVREPTNAYDPNAVQVWIAGNRVGYIPRKDNLPLSQFIDQTGATMAMDEAFEPQKGIRARFIRSPNSAYPQVEVE